MKKVVKQLSILMIMILGFGLMYGCGVNELTPTPLPSLPGTNQSSVLPDYWVENSNINVFKDTQKGDSSMQTIEFHIARNERESAQIVLRSLFNFDIIGVEFGDLTDSQRASAKISKDNLKSNFVEYVYLDSNSPGSVDSDIVKKGAGFYPDALSNSQQIRVAKQSSQAIWITLFVPKQTSKGEYQGQVTVKTSNGDIKVDIRANVYDVVVPDSSEGEYSIAFWNQLLGAGFGVSYPDYHGGDIIAIKYGYERWTEGWWQLINDIADEMAENRLNAVQIHTVQLLADGGSAVNADGTFDFNWSKFDEYVQFFIDKGFVKKLNGYIMMAGSNVNLLRRDAKGRTATGQIGYTSQEADNWLNAYIPALKEHLEEKGWLDMWFQNLKDEAKVADKPIYNYIYNKARTLAPEIKVGDALDDMAMIDFMKDLDIDVHIPLIDMHTYNLSKYTSLGDDKLVFTYTCVAPQGIQLNRFIDKPVWQGKSIGWYNYNSGANGFLHWGLMAWYREIYEFANGDTATIYPDIENNTIKSSIRMAAVRDGAEDYELLKVLEKQEIIAYKQANPTDKELSGLQLVSKGLANVIASSSASYTRDINLMVQVRVALLKALEGDFASAEAIIANA